MRVLLGLVLIAIYSTLGVVRPITNFLRDRGLLRISVAIAFVAAATAALWAIFRVPANRSPRVILSLTVVVAIYAAVILPMESPEEKIHFIEYGVVALLAEAAMPRSWVARKRSVYAAGFVTAAGWIDELIQGLLPARYYDLRDVAFNAIAGVIALIALAVVSRTARA